MTRLFPWVGIASVAIGLALAPQAAARIAPKAKFRVVSASGVETLSFHEDDGDTSSSDGCVGAAESRVSWRMTRPRTVFVFLYDGLSVSAGIDDVHLPRTLADICGGSGIAAGIAVPFTYEARQALGLPTVSARAISRRQLLDPHRKRLHAS